MCGILGMSGKNEGAVTAAAKAFSYRGPDAFGIYADESVTLGHNRLSIIDLDARSTQPLFEATGELGIVFNGEIYNYKDVRAILQATGKYEFRTTSDTEVVLFAYQEWGKGMMEHIAGMFAFAIYDRRRNVIVLATDHVSMKPLFYGSKNGTFFFASSLAGMHVLAAKAGMRLDVCKESLELFFALGYIPAPHTLYEDVHRMPKAGWVEYDLATKDFDTGTYEVLSIVPEEVSPEWMEERVLTHLVADVPVGLFFSGGTDSSYIASVLHTRSVELETFSADIAGRGTDAKYFDAIAAELGIDANRFSFGVEDFNACYGELRDRIDEPLYDNSLFVTYFIAKKAAGKIKVVLSGDGGDELYSGYPRSLVLNRMASRPLDASLTMLERIFFHIPAFKGKNKVFEKLFVALRHPVAFYLMDSSPAKNLLSRNAWAHAKKEIARQSPSAERFDLDLFLPGNLLRKTDLATMYASIEGRLPFLDPGIMESAARLPLPIDSATGLKPELKSLLARYLPAELVYRPKSGFHLPSNVLFAGSSLLCTDLSDAIQYLRGKKLLAGMRLPAIDVLKKRYPSLCFAMVSLYHTLRNADRFYAA